MRAITTNGIEVKIYKTKSYMRKAIRRIGYNCSKTEAMVIPCTVYAFENGKQVRKPIYGEMYIHENAAMPILVHETLHAATTVIRKTRKRSLNLGSGIRREEERLAYTQTAILQDILKIFFPLKNSNHDLGDIEWWVNGSIKENS